MNWPTEIKARAERLTVMLVLSTFTAYLTIFTFGVTRYVA
jgi:hypothetical protein